MKKIIFLALTCIALTACENTDSLNTKEGIAQQTEEKLVVVVVPEGYYTQRNNPDTLLKPKKGFGKVLKGALGELKNQFIFDSQLIVKKGDLLSPNIMGEKTMPIETGDLQNDSTFFVNMPIMGNSQTIQLKLLSKNSFSLHWAGKEYLFSM